VRGGRERKKEKAAVETWESTQPRGDERSSCGSSAFVLKTKKRRDAGKMSFEKLRTSRRYKMESVLQFGFALV
jgi:hypothetical protein